MARILSTLNLYLPERDLTDISEDSFWTYLVWQDDKREAKKRVIKPFESGLFSLTGYDDFTRPEREEETEIKIGDDIEFLVRTAPTTKRPSYSLVNREFGNYLDFLSEQHSKGISRKGVRTYKGMCYVLVDDLIEKISSDLENLREGREGVRQKAEFLRPENLLRETPESISIVLGRDYSAITDYNARMYVYTGNFLKEGEKRAGKFKTVLLYDSLNTIGSEPEEVTALSYPFEDSVFIHQLEPRRTPQHKNVITAFINPPPKRITNRSVIGDLVKIKMMKEQGQEEYLREKGLIDDDFINDYKPQLIDGKSYVLLGGTDEDEAGIRKRLKQYRERFVTRNIEQNIYMRPKKLMK